MTDLPRRAAPDVPVFFAPEPAGAPLWIALETQAVQRSAGASGFAAMLVALPAAVAFGVTVYSAISPQYAAFGALAGILGATALGLLAPTFGGTDRLISAPCARAGACRCRACRPLGRRSWLGRRRRGARRRHRPAAGCR